MSVRAKFKCVDKYVRPIDDVTSVVDVSFTQGKDSFSWTSSDSLIMTFANRDAYNWFEKDKEYYLDFTKAD